MSLLDRAAERRDRIIGVVAGENHRRADFQQISEIAFAGDLGRRLQGKFRDDAIQEFNILMSPSGGHYLIDRFGGFLDLFTINVEMGDGA